MNWEASVDMFDHSQPWTLTQRAQYPLIKEYGLNYIGLHIMI